MKTVTLKTDNSWYILLKTCEVSSPQFFEFWCRFSMALHFLLTDGGFVWEDCLSRPFNKQEKLGKKVKVSLISSISSSRHPSINLCINNIYFYVNFIFIFNYFLIFLSLSIHTSILNYLQSCLSPPHLRLCLLLHVNIHLCFGVYLRHTTTPSSQLYSLT